VRKSIRDVKTERRKADVWPSCWRSLSVHGQDGVCNGCIIEEEVVVVPSSQFTGCWLSLVLFSILKKKPNFRFYSPDNRLYSVCCDRHRTNRSRLAHCPPVQCRFHIEGKDPRVYRPYCVCVCIQESIGFDPTLFLKNNGITRRRI
jgi:hypothetical protein